MLKKISQIVISLLIGGVFLWLAFRDIDLAQLGKHIRQMSVGWLFPYAIVFFGSHYLRAERWKLLIEQNERALDRATLFSGVMVGYMLNLIFPKLGEVTRPMYVAKREKLSSVKLIGTIVSERVIDILTIIILMLMVSFYLIADTSLLIEIFGKETIIFFRNGVAIDKILLLFLGIIPIGFIYLLYRKLEVIGSRFEWLEYWLLKIKGKAKLFWRGIISVRDIKRWWLFLFLTALMWIGYTMMSFIPFWMFDLQKIYGLTPMDAFVIAVISSIGMALPIPGGIGTYHYLVKQSLLVLFFVPVAYGIAYATITHAAMVLMISLTTLIMLAIDWFRFNNT